MQNKQHNYYKRALYICQHILS